MRLQSPALKETDESNLDQRWQVSPGIRELLAERIRAAQQALRNESSRWQGTRYAVYFDEMAGSAAQPEVELKWMREIAREYTRKNLFSKLWWCFLNLFEDEPVDIDLCMNVDGITSLRELSKIVEGDGVLAGIKAYENSGLPEAIDTLDKFKAMFMPMGWRMLLDHHVRQAESSVMEEAEKYIRQCYTDFKHACSCFLVAAFHRKTRLQDDVGLQFPAVKPDEKILQGKEGLVGGMKDISHQCRNFDQERQKNLTRLIIDTEQKIFSIEQFLGIFCEVLGNEQGRLGRDVPEMIKISKAVREYFAGLEKSNELEMSGDNFFHRYFGRMNAMSLNEASASMLISLLQLLQGYSNNLQKKHGKEKCGNQVQGETSPGKADELQLVVFDPSSGCNLEDVEEVNGYDLIRVMQAEALVNVCLEIEASEKWTKQELAIMKKENRRERKEIRKYVDKNIESLQQGLQELEEGLRQHQQDQQEFEEEVRRERLEFEERLQRECGEQEARWQQELEERLQQERRGREARFQQIEDRFARLEEQQQQQSQQQPDQQQDATSSPRFLGSGTSS